MNRAKDKKVRTASTIYLRSSKYSTTCAYSMPTSRNSAPSKNPMKPSDASRIQSTQAKASNNTGSNSFPTRAQSAAASNTTRGIVNPSGGTATRTGGPGTPKAATASAKTPGGVSRK